MWPATRPTGRYTSHKRREPPRVILRSRATCLRHGRDIPATKQTRNLRARRSHAALKVTKRSLQKSAICPQFSERLEQVLAAPHCCLSRTCPRQSCPCLQGWQRAFAAACAFECLRTFSRSDYATSKTLVSLAIRQCSPG